MAAIYAGVIPYAINPKNNKYFVLLGFEASFRADRPWDKGWSGFGGAPEIGESLLETAAREGYEESMGFLGSINAITKQLEQNLDTFSETTKYGKKVHHYMLKIPYDVALPKHYANVYAYAKSGFLANCPSIPAGYLEKSKIRWFTLAELAKNQHWRGAFANTAEILLEHFTLQQNAENEKSD